MATNKRVSQTVESAVGMLGIGASVEAFLETVDRHFENAPDECGHRLRDPEYIKDLRRLRNLIQAA